MTVARRPAGFRPGDRVTDLLVGEPRYGWVIPSADGVLAVLWDDRPATPEQAHPGDIARAGQAAGAMRNPAAGDNVNPTTGLHPTPQRVSTR